MAKEQKQLCPYCRQNISVIKHSLSPGLAKSLARFAKACGEGNWLHLDEVFSNYANQSNFQKLQYWYFVERAIVKNGEPKGNWKLKPNAFKFLYEGQLMPKKVGTRRAEVVWFEPDHSKWVTLDDVKKSSDPYWQEEW